MYENRSGTLDAQRDTERPRRTRKEKRKRIHAHSPSSSRRSTCMKTFEKAASCFRSFNNCAREAKPTGALCVTAAFPVEVPFVVFSAVNDVNGACHRRLVLTGRYEGSAQTVAVAQSAFTSAERKRIAAG